MLDEGYATALSGHSLRFSEREVSPVPLPQAQNSGPLKTSLCLHAFKTQPEEYYSEREMRPVRILPTIWVSKPGIPKPCWH
jgi:hypothetical protein